jgi:hypothetical protein
MTPNKDNWEARLREYFSKNNPLAGEHWVEGMIKIVRGIEAAAYVRGKAEMVEEIKGLIKNIRRFDEKEQGADYFAGWDNALDTMKLDIKEFLSLQDNLSANNER